jgi:hypothetical protein
LFSGRRNAILALLPPPLVDDLLPPELPQPVAAIANTPQSAPAAATALVFFANIIEGLLPTSETWAAEAALRRKVTRWSRTVNRYGLDLTGQEGG